MINNDNSKKSTKSSTKHLIVKNFAYYVKFCKIFFYLHKIISRQFFILPVVFILTKNFNTAHTHTEVKPNLLHSVFLVTIFVSFFKLLSISLDKHNLFLSHLK